MKSQPPKAYIFDMDGTIVDNCAYHVLAWQKFSRKYGRELTEKEVLDWMGAQGAYYVEQIFGRELPAEEVARLCAEKEALYRELYKPVLPDGLREWLDYAHLRKVPCALATGGPRENVDFILDALHLRDDFAVIVDSSMYTHSKPDPECFLKAAELLGVEPALCRVYEDAVNGIKAAKAAGMSVVAVTFTNPREVLEETWANRVIDSYRELDIWPVRKERTPEEEAAVAYLDKLRACTDEPAPIVPLACAVRVVALENVPKAGERYALATVEAAGSRTWRVCVLRETVRVGEDALFVTPEVALPDEPRFKEAFHGLPRVYKYGFGVSERVLQPHLTRNIYHNNPGQLSPLARFPEVRPMMQELDVMRVLKLQTFAEIRKRVCAPVPAKPKAKKVAVPPPKASPKKASRTPMTFLEKVRRHRARFEESVKSSRFAGQPRSSWFNEGPKSNQAGGKMRTWHPDAGETWAPQT